MSKTPPMTKFLLCPDEENKELYILHREFPACLIWIKQEAPLTFVIQDLYGEVDDTNDILTMSFVQEVKDFFNRFVENSTDQN